jgi:hypothetical protein
MRNNIIIVVSLVVLIGSFIALIMTMRKHRYANAAMVSLIVLAIIVVLYVRYSVGP